MLSPDKVGEAVASFGDQLKAARQGLPPVSWDMWVLVGRTGFHRLFQKQSGAEQKIFAVVVK